MLGRIVYALKSNPLLYKLGRSSLFFARGLLPPLTLEGVPGPVHRNDYMLGDRSAQRVKEYREGAEVDSAWVVSRVERYLGWDKVSALLDFGGGYGRLSRHFARKLRPEQVTLSEVVPEAVRFVERALKVKGLHGARDIESTPFGRYQVVVAHGVLTNLGPERQRAFFRTVERIVDPGGMVFFSAQGTIAAERASRVRPYFDPAEITARLAAEGMLFFPYQHQDDPEYGDVFVNDAHLRKVIAAQAPSFEVMEFTPAVWAQDHWVLRRKG